MATLDEIFDRVEDQAVRTRLRHEYGTIKNWLAPLLRKTDLRVLDFGCGEGIAAAAFALRHPDAAVFGTDIGTVDAARLGERLRRLTGLDLPANLSLELAAPSSLSSQLDNFDLIYSWSVFEHIERDAIADVLKLLHARLRPGGMLFVQIEPLFFSPFGSHLRQVAPEPWAHLTLPLDKFQARLFGHDFPQARKERLWTQYCTLNRITAPDLLDYGVNAGFAVARQEVSAVAMAPPEALLRAHNRDALTTNEVRALFRPIG